MPRCEHKRETGARAVGELGAVVDLWNINSPHYFGNLAETRKLKASGKTLYFYSGTPRVDEVLLRSIYCGWNGYKYEADGVCFWNATDWTDWDTDTPQDDAPRPSGFRVPPHD